MTSLELLALLNVLLLLSAHFVADFLLQSDWMATNKSKDWLALTTHASVYAVTMTVAFWGMTLTDWNTVFLFGGWTFLTHWLTDAVTSRITSRLWFFEQVRNAEGIPRLVPHILAHNSGLRTTTSTLVPAWTLREGNRRHWFFVVIGLDQLIHAWTLVLTFAWVLR